ncbi:MAG: PASTA domain-containing protein [Rhodobacterales bacterium]|nr:PASTA domain-containing protein [Rhodobacterales bacterium]
MSKRLHLPPIEPPVEHQSAVRKRAAGRIKLVGGMLMLLVFSTGARGVQLSMSPSDRTIRAASVQRWNQVTVQARRGEILDRNGRRLATSVATPNIVVDPIRVSPNERAALAAQVAAILDLPEAEVFEKMGRSSRYAKLSTRVHPAIAARVEALRHPALWTERNSRRFYPEESLAAQVVGFVDGSGAGREGMEAKLDEYLRGGALLRQRRRDRRGLAVEDPSGWSGSSNVGMDVHTTLDRTIQRIPERALEGVVENSAPLAVSAVVVDVKTGDILAMANAPTFNPNKLSGEAAPRKNHVVQDAIEAGSVFKPFTAAAAVEEGLVTENTMVNCEGGLYYIGRTAIHDDHPHRMITMSEVIKYSSNICSAKLALQMGADTFLGYIHDFGFGQRTGIPLPGERAGRVRKADKIRPIELATTSYGQGVTTTPLQMAMATAALANGGVRMKPRLLSRVEDQHGIPEFVQQPATVMRVVSADSANSVTRMMVTVTEPGGTATRAAVHGYKVAGKTGTAEKVKNGVYTRARIGSFMGFVPADNPVVAIVVIVDEPSKGSRYGGIVAAPAFSEIAGQTLRYLGVPPDSALLDLDEDTSSDEALVAVADVEALSLHWERDAWTLPDLVGRDLREVMVGLQGAALDLQIEGSGNVVSQYPPAGSYVRPGTPIRVALQ